jgi:hypothetical protein
MRQTIRVERLLRESIQTPYCDLVTRSTGRAVRTSIERELSEADAGVAHLDFSDIGLVDLSGADEVVAKLLLDPPCRTIVVLEGLRDEHLEAIEYVLAHHELAALVHDGASDSYRPVGRVPPDLRAAFLTLQTLGTGTAASVADQIGWNLARATEALQALLRLRLVRAEGDRYTTPLPA